MAVAAAPRIPIKGLIVSQDLTLQLFGVLNHDLQFVGKAEWHRLGAQYFFGQIEPPRDELAPQRHQIPYFCRRCFVRGRGHEIALLGRKGHGRGDAQLLRRELSPIAARSRVRESQSAIRLSHGQHAAVGREGNAQARWRGAQRAQLPPLPGFRVPQRDAVSRRRQPAIIRTESNHGMLSQSQIGHMAPVIASQMDAPPWFHVAVAANRASLLTAPFRGSPVVGSETMLRALRGWQHNPATGGLKQECLTTVVRR